MSGLLTTTLTDETTGTFPGFTLENLESMVEEIAFQPVEWRENADTCAAYYDNRQLPYSVIADLKAKKLPPIIQNLIAPAVDSVLGIEAKTRTDPIVQADDDSGLEVAEALNECLHEAQRLSNADRAISDAYAGEIKSGLGWVETNRNSDPFADCPYRVGYVHRREIHWDWFARDPGLSDARWLRRERWLDVDEALMAFPQHKMIIENAANGWGDWTYDRAIDAANNLSMAFNDYESSQTKITEEDWLDQARKRVKIYEVWYRHTAMTHVMKLPDGRVVTYNKKDPKHIAVVGGGHVQLSKVPVTFMRMSYFIGPHRVWDGPSPLPHNNFPYTPFWGYREDGNGSPYSFILRMIPAQDEVNYRRMKLTWLLKAKRVIKDDDAFTGSDEELLAKLAHPESVINLNPNRQKRDENSFKVETDLGIAQQQFTVMQDAVRLIGDTIGAHNSFLGKESGANSGIAINSLIEQTSTTMAEVNDNYQFGRRQVFESMLAFIVQDMGKKEQRVLKDLHRPVKTKEIFLNRMEVDENGNEFLNNNVQLAKKQVVLADVATSAGYRQQLLERMMNLASTSPPAIQIAIFDMVVEQSDLPNRDEWIKRIREVSGHGADPEDMSEEDKAAMQKKQQMAEQQEALAMQDLQSKVSERLAKIRLVNAQATEVENAVDLSAPERTAKIEKIRNESEKIFTDIEQLNQQMDNMLGEQVEREANALRALNVA